MYQAVLNQATTFRVDLPARPDDTVTFTVANASGGSVQSSTSATRDAVATTLSGAHAAGTKALTVASGTGIATNRRYLVGGPEVDGGEFVTIKSAVSAALTAWRPLRVARTTGAAFESTRVSCAVSAISVPARHYRLVLSWNVGAVAQPPVTIPFDVSRYALVSTVAWEDVVDSDPLIVKRLPEGAIPQAYLDRAYEMIVRRVAQKKDPGALVGAINVSIPQIYLTRALVSENGGSEWAEQARDLRARFREELDSSLGSAAFDDDQDGAIEAHEVWSTSVDIVRA